jgi:hypothetical protein
MRNTALKQLLDKKLAYLSNNDNSTETIGWVFQMADGRLGKRLSICKDGSLQTNFMTYAEMNMFLGGYIAKTNAIK